MAESTHQSKNWYRTIWQIYPCINGGRMAELADAQDSKSCDSNIMRVRLSLRPPFVRGAHDFHTPKQSLIRDKQNRVGFTLISVRLRSAAQRKTVSIWTVFLQLNISFPRDKQSSPDPLRREPVSDIPRLFLPIQSPRRPKLYHRFW